MICTKCGKTLTDGAAFCAFCGARVSAPNIASGNEAQSTVQMNGSQYAILRNESQSIVSEISTPTAGSEQYTAYGTSAKGGNTAFNGMSGNDITNSTAYNGTNAAFNSMSGNNIANGAATRSSEDKNNAKILYRLADDGKRKYSVTVDRSALHITGRFWYLTDKEFVRCKEKAGTGLIRNFIGMGYLAKRSPRTTILFVLAGSILELIKFIIDKLTEGLDKVNDYLKWIDHEISLPEWMNNTMNAVAVICILIGIALFFSKKKVIEISFTDKRICVPEKSMTQSEYGALYKSIVNAKNTGRRQYQNDAF